MPLIANFHAEVADKPIVNGLSLPVNAGVFHVDVGPNGLGLVA